MTIRPGPNALLPALKKPRAKSRDLEHIEHSLFMQWVEAQSGGRPKLRKLFAIPNFSGRLGKKAPIAAIRQGQRLNKEGRKKGIPDLCWPVAYRGYFGLYLEMKALGERARPEQIAWHVALREEGYCVVVCDSAIVAQDVVDWYSRGPETPKYIVDRCPFSS